MKAVPADKETRLLRQRAHLSFDRIWRRGHMTRAQAYAWLARQLKVPPQKAHMGQMTDHGLLRKVVRVSDAYVGASTAADDFPDDIEDKYR